MDPTLDGLFKTARAKVTRKARNERPNYKILIVAVDFDNLPKQSLKTRCSKRVSGRVASTKLWFGDEPYGEYGVYVERSSKFRHPAWLDYRAVFLLRWLYFAWTWMFPRLVNDGGVVLKKRTYKNTAHRFYTLNVTETEMHNIFGIAYLARACRFNENGRAWSWTKCWRRCTYDRWFCSELVFYMLQKSGVLKRLAAEQHIPARFARRDPGSVTPTNLIDGLQNATLRSSNMIYGGETYRTSLSDIYNV